MFFIDNRSTKPIYEQIIDTVKEQILKGNLNEGDQLPSVRQLASLLTVNPNTVSKAYQELEHDRIIQTVRGKGTFISQINKKTVNHEKLDDIKIELKKLCIELYYMGMNQEQIISEVKVVLKGIEGVEGEV
ncbi:MAG: GntR family transcriptional regulator [Cellulosilyticaceae bacterium]